MPEANGKINPKHVYHLQNILSGIEKNKNQYKADKKKKKKTF